MTAGDGGADGLLLLDPEPEGAGPAQPAASAGRRGGPRHATSARGARARPPGPRHANRHDGMLRFSVLSLLGLVPGAGLVGAGKKWLGGLLLVPVVAVVALLVAAVVDAPTRTTVLSLGVRPGALSVLVVVLLAAGLVWVASIAFTGWVARPAAATRAQRVVGVALVAVLAAVVAVPDGFAARTALVQKDVVESLFKDGSQLPTQPGVAKPTSAPRADPWAGTPRVNMLLLGSDAGTDRTGLRTDSMMVASINTRTGKTVLLSLPRNLQRVPFPANNPLHALYPNGYDCGSECLLNAVWTEADNHRSLFKGDKEDPGLTTVRGVIGQVLGLRIDYTTIIDLKGFSGLVNAMGGVVVNVPRRIPIGGGHNEFTGAALPITGWIEPGRQRLTGYQALWFSRSREGSDDYDRMRRQRCMTGALLAQSNPVQLLENYPKLASVLKQNVKTDVPRGDLPAWVTLVQRIQHGGVSSLPFTDDVISTVHPDFAHIRALVQKAITKQPKKGKHHKGSKDAEDAFDIGSTC